MLHAAAAANYTGQHSSSVKPHLHDEASRTSWLVSVCVNLYLLLFIVFVHIHICSHSLIPSFIPSFIQYHVYFCVNSDGGSGEVS